MFQGYETTATSTAYVLLMIAMYPEYQNNILEEINSVLPDRNTPLTPDNIKLMTYLDIFIKETLRLFPAVPYLTRMATKDVKIGKKNCI